MSVTLSQWINLSNFLQSILFGDGDKAYQLFLLLLLGMSGHHLFAHKFYKDRFLLFLLVQLLTWMDGFEFQSVHLLFCL